MAEDTKFEGGWNANKGYLQLMIDYIALSGQYNINEDVWHEYLTVKQLYKITNHVVDQDVTAQAKIDLKEVKDKLRPKGINPNTSEGQSLIHNRKEEAEDTLEKVEMALIANIHKNNLILPRKQQQKGMKQLWEEYGLDDDNTEGTGEDNAPILQEASPTP
jgi:hypothetical protein